MRQLNKWQTVLFIIGGMLMVAGVGIFVFVGSLRPWAAWAFLIGACLYTAMQILQTYEGNNFVISRLRRILLLSDFAFILAGLLMVEQSHNYLLPLFINRLEQGINAYVSYVMNKWVVVLLVGAILQVYTTHRMSSELAKDAKKM